jgi:methylphosphotriester-DNA--protein-cysteine methyltransferase
VGSCTSAGHRPSRRCTPGQSPEDSRKIWELSERLVGVNLPRLISR